MSIFWCFFLSEYYPSKSHPYINQIKKILLKKSYMSSYYCFRLVMKTNPKTPSPNTPPNAVNAGMELSTVSTVQTEKWSVSAVNTPSLYVESVITNSSVSSSKYAHFAFESSVLMLSRAWMSQSSLIVRFTWNCSWYLYWKWWEKFGH